MKIETRQETVNYEVYVSEDGQYSRTVKGMSDDEKAKVCQEIKDYEQSAKCVLFARLKQRNVLGEVLYTHQSQHDDGTPLTDEEKAAQNAVWLLDNIMDDGCGRSEYYILTPHTEDDIKDLCTYCKLEFQYTSVLDGSEGNDYNRNTSKIEAGKQYVLQMNGECEYFSIVSMPLLQKRIEKMCSWFDKLGKAQLKK